LPMVAIYRFQLGSALFISEMLSEVERYGRKTKQRDSTLGMYVG